MRSSSNSKRENDNNNENNHGHGDRQREGGGPADPRLFLVKTVKYFRFFQLSLFRIRLRSLRSSLRASNNRNVNISPIISSNMNAFEG
jgi:hypothetical protein